MKQFLHAEVFGGWAARPGALPAPGVSRGRFRQTGRVIERYPVLGRGVCLNVGCIPSKALLHTAQIIHEAEEFEEHGVSYGKPTLDIDKIRAWKEKHYQNLK